MEEFKKLNDNFDNLIIEAVGKKNTTTRIVNDLKRKITERDTGDSLNKKIKMSELEHNLSFDQMFREHIIQYMDSIDALNLLETNKVIAIKAKEYSDEAITKFINKYISGELKEYILPDEMNKWTNAFIEKYNAFNMEYSAYKHINIAQLDKESKSVFDAVYKKKKEDVMMLLSVFLKRQIFRHVSICCHSIIWEKINITRLFSLLLTNIQRGSLFTSGEAMVENLLNDNTSSITMDVKKLILHIYYQSIYRYVFSKSHNVLGSVLKVITETCKFENLGVIDEKRTFVRLSILYNIISKFSVMVFYDFMESDFINAEGVDLTPQIYYVLDRKVALKTLAFVFSYFRSFMTYIDISWFPLHHDHDYEDTEAEHRPFYFYYTISDTLELVYQKTRNILSYKKFIDAVCQYIRYINMYNPSLFDSLFSSKFHARPFFFSKFIRYTVIDKDMVNLAILPLVEIAKVLIDKENTPFDRYKSFMTILHDSRIFEDQEIEEDVCDFLGLVGDLFYFEIYRWDESLYNFTDVFDKYFSVIVKGGVIKHSWFSELKALISCKYTHSIKMDMENDESAKTIHHVFFYQFPSYSTHKDRMWYRGLYQGSISNRIEKFAELGYKIGIETFANADSAINDTIRIIMCIIDVDRNENCLKGLYNELPLFVPIDYKQPFYQTCVLMDMFEDRRYFETLLAMTGGPDESVIKYKDFKESAIKFISDVYDIYIDIFEGIQKQLFVDNHKKLMYIMKHFNN